MTCGVVYATKAPSTVRATPRSLLAEMSLQHDPGGNVDALHLAASIIASNDGPEDSAVIRRRYQHEVADLRAVAARNLQHAKDDIEFVYGLEVLMAFENGGVWQRNLHCLANGEAELECPSCGEFLLLGLDGPEFRMESFADGSPAPTAVMPVEPSAATVEGRLLALAHANDRPAVAGKLPFLFGDATCPPLLRILPGFPGVLLTPNRGLLSRCRRRP
jgi:hypothetical protein